MELARAILLKTVRLSVLLGVLGTAFVAWRFGKGPALSFAASVGLMAGNFWGITGLVNAILDPDMPKSRRTAAAVIFAIKSVGLLVGLGLVLGTGLLDPGAFGAGLSVVVVSIVAAAFAQDGEGPPTAAS